MKSRQIVLAARPIGLPTYENFRYENIELEEIKDNEVLLKASYISVDPYMRGRMNDVKSYAPSFQLDQPIAGGVVAEVIKSKKPAHAPVLFYLQVFTGRTRGLRYSSPGLRWSIPGWRSAP